VINFLLAQHQASAAPAAAPLVTTATTLDAEPASEASAVAVALAMPAPASAAAVADDDAAWMPGDDLDEVAADAAASSLAAAEAGQPPAGAFATDELDLVDEELDSILDDLTLDARDRVWV
jgi:hypothetical protein